MYNTLKKCFLFKDVTPEKLKLYIKNINYRIIEYKKGQYIADFSNEIGIVLKGKIEVQKNLLTGKKIIMNRIKAGSIFGIPYLFQKELENVTYLYTNSEAVVLFITESCLLKLFKMDEVILQNYLSYVGQRIYF
ncbi:Crp/Fnr family transcriptional regulator [Alkaliphilus pronyensis]|uniref:Crp/Fnr family transcriptional regulator n=1 Tax=Alkaliphilus pronyensis TaxID=1482732 RepID=A0A6I0F250_9FIRM|nr:cyclic nucleotide-binding domain-containing protein [Alkaliphilus pronyensis]KAB3536057.1 Crp/Fnr family transcriptional regulator [Alkaliphilus pronyensis]